jgi:hexosaminidase
MKKIFISFIAGLFCVSAVCLAQDNAGKLAIVPYPKNINVNQKISTFEAAQMGVKAGAGCEAFAGVMKDDIYRLTGIKPAGSAKAVIHLIIKKSLKPNRYQLKVKDGQVNIIAGNLSGISMGWTSFLQAAEIQSGKITVNNLTIEDAPDLEYRGFMLDLARHFHNDNIVKQVIDMCRWYKINYLQFHLTDTERNVFPTKLFPKTLKAGEYYTEQQLKDIIAYADARGVTLIPEVEGPGHAYLLNKSYPEIFGDPNLYVVNIADEKAVDAMKQLSKEVMDFFNTSPYFHIGADEVNLNVLKNLPLAKEVIKAKGYNDVHDLYLKYVADMHAFVKQNGKQTLVWEGFDKDGSDKVKIPKDIIVMAFETVYQRPDSLVNRGYRIINSIWKPLYIVQNRRWSAEKIYSWHYGTWEHWWEPAPAFKAPIFLNEAQRKMIVGTMMCSWELTEEMEYPALRKSLAAFAERSWNTTPLDSYAQFELRMNSSKKQLHKLLYPFEISARNLVEPDYKGVYYNRDNYFAAPLMLSFKSNIPGAVLRYTTDRSFPNTNASVVPENLSFTESTFLKIAQYDASGNLLSYYPVWYENKPVKVEFIGEGNNEDNESHEVTFTGTVKVKMSTPHKEGSIRYTVDGSEPTITSREYIREIEMDKAFQLRIRYFDKTGKPQGSAYNFQVKKK